MNPQAKYFLVFYLHLVVLRNCLQRGGTKHIPSPEQAGIPSGYLGARLDEPTGQILPGVLLALGLATQLSSTERGQSLSLPRNRRAEQVQVPSNKTKTCQVDRKLSSM